MKKRLFGMLPMLAALVAVCALSVSAVDEDFFTGTGYCEACGDTVSWQPLTQELVTAWNGDYSTANGTHYYVSETTVTTTKSLTVDTGEVLHLHLKGNTFKRGGVRAITVNGQLAVMDHSAGKGVLQAGANNTSTGGVVRLNKSGAKFDLYGGTVKMVSGTNTEADNGGCVYQVSGTTFNMHGGALSGGKSDGSGGSLYVANGATAALTGGTIDGGVAAKNGGNIYNAGKLILGSCAISGGSAESGADLYVDATGKLEIKSGFASTVRAVFNEGLLPVPLNGGVLAETVATCEGAFPGKICLENQSREAYLYGKDGETKLYAFVDVPENTPLPTTCAHCKAPVTWLPLTADVVAAWDGDYSTADGTHYYVAEDTLTVAKRLTLAAGETLCLHLNGRDFTMSGTRIFAVSGTLNLLDHASNRGTVSAIGDYSSTGCVIRIYDGGAVNLYGGTVKMLTGSTTAKTFAGNGGCVYLAEGGEFTMHGGIVEGGKASTGGNVYVSKNATFTLKGGTVKNGQTVSTAPHSSITVNNKHGGNVYLAAGATMEMTGGTVENGVAVESGGNIMSSGTFTITTGTISGGQAKLGGNLYVAGGATGNINGGTVTGGTATDRGGNLYMSSTSSKLYMTAGTISGGTSTNGGGNAYLNNGIASLTGGTITGGKAGTSGGNLYVNAGANSASNYVKPDGVTVTGGKAGSYGGNLYVSGSLTLGSSAVTGGEATKGGNDIFLDTKGKLTVQKNFAGETTVKLTAAHLPDLAPDAAEGAFSGKLYLEGDQRKPYLFGRDGDTKLYMTVAARVKTDGTYIWYRDNAALMAALDGTEDHLCAAAGALVLTGGEYLVDLGGQNVHITGTGSVTFFDSANADGKTYGTATVSGVTVKNGAKTTVKDQLYFTLREEEAYSFHLLRLELTNVNIRPASAGIYYDGVWDCDEKLTQELVDSYGVAVSLVAMPGTNFDAEGSSCLYTAYGKDTLESGTTRTGVIIEGILAEKETPDRNNKNGRRSIYARAYLKLTDGTVIMSDTGAAESLYSATTRLDRLIDENPYIYRHYQSLGQDFVETWLEDGMGTWELKNLLPSARLQESPEEAEALKIMIIGSSRSVNTFYMLYDVFKDQMPDKEIVIGVMYYSGGSMSMHADFARQNAQVYRYYRNTSGVMEIMEPVTLDYGLKDQKWDAIFLQAGNGDLANQLNLEDRLYLTDYVDKVITDHPHEFWFHTTWFNSTDPALYVNANTTIDPTTVDQYKTLNQGIDAAKAYVFNDPMFAGRICSGTPMMYALKVLEVPEVELYRDHTHLSDYGCLLVGYSFYTQFTGNPVTQINLDTLAVAKRQPQYQSKGDLTITQEMKDIIIQTADYTHKNPWTAPVKEEQS